MRQLFTVDSAATRQHMSSSRTHTSTLRWTLVALVLSATLLTTKAAAAAEELVLADEDALVDAPTITSVSSNGVAVPQMDAVVLPDELLQATNPPSADVGIAILAGTIQPSGAPTSGVASTLHAGGSLAVAFTMAFLLMASAILPLGHF